MFEEPVQDAASIIREAEEERRRLMLSATESGQKLGMLPSHSAQPEVADPSFAIKSLVSSNESRIRGSRTWESISGVGSITDPATAAKALQASHDSGNSSIDMLDADTRAAYARSSKILGLPPEFFSSSKTASWLSKNMLRVDMTGLDLDPLLSLEDKLRKAEQESIYAKNLREGKAGFKGLLKHGFASAAETVAGIGMIPDTVLRAVATYAGLGDTYKSVMGESMRGTISEFYGGMKRAQSSGMLTDPKTGEQFIDFQSVNPLTLRGLETLGTAVASEAPAQALMMLITALNPAAAAPVLTEKAAGLKGAAGAFSATMRHYMTRPTALINTGRVIQGQAFDGVHEVMAKNPGMSEAEAWEKVAPGALLAGILSGVAGSPLEAKFMEDLFAKTARIPGYQTFLKRSGSRVLAGLSSGFKEGVQEVFEGVGEDLAAFLTYSPDKTMKEFAANALQNFAGGFAIGGPSGGLIQGSHAIRASNNAAFIDALHNSEARAAFVQQAPSEQASFVKELTQGGDLETLAIDARGYARLLQSQGLDPKIEAQKLGVKAEDFDLALENGGDLIADTSLYAKEALSPAFQAVRDVTRAYQGGPTIKQLQDGFQARNDRDAVEEAIKILPPIEEDPNRKVIRDKIAAQIKEATRVLPPASIEQLADHYSRVLTVLAQKSGKDVNELFENNKLSITRGAHELLDSRVGENRGLEDIAGPEVREAAAQVPATGVRGATEALPGQNVSVPAESVGAAAQGLRRGAAPPAGLWHGTAATGIGALRAEGISQTGRIHGGMGPGLHLSAGPDVANQYTEGNKNGLWQVGLRQDFKPFDAALDSTYTPEEAAAFGVETSTQLTGHDMWEALVTRTGSPDAAAEFLQEQGFDGLYYNHGEEDAWSVWRDDKLVGSRPTTMEKAQEIYGRQGSRRDPLTGRLVDQNAKMKQEQKDDRDPREAQRERSRVLSTAAASGRAGAQGNFGTAPWAYSRRGPEADGVSRVLGVPVLETWSLGEKKSTELQAMGINSPDLHELDYNDPNAAKVFRDAISALREGNKYAASVHVYDESEYAGMRMFLTEDGKAGFALKPDGDIISVFVVTHDGNKGASHSMLEIAKQSGGVKLDCFDTVLPSLYAQHGFEGVARVAWDDEHAPEDWSKETFAKYNNGEPDVVLMAYSPTAAMKYSKESTPLVESYDEAVQLQLDAVDQFSPKTRLFQSATIRGGSETLEKFGIKPNTKYTVREIAKALEDRQRKKFGLIDPKDRSPEASKKIAKWMVDEILFEMANPEKSAVGWYSTKFQNALDTFSREFPELKTDQGARDLLTALIAITSDGQSVLPNFQQAVDLYGNFRKTGEFTTERGHNRQASIDNNLRIITDLLKTRTPDQLRNELLHEATVSELSKLAKERGVEFNTEYQASVKLPMAAIVFGPKLGAFYANLMGASGYLTMDRWWSRTFNRYRGVLIPEPTRQGVDRLKVLLGDPNMSDEAAIEATKEYRKSYEAKKFKNGTELEKAANTIWKAAFGELNDAPFNASDRTFMLNTVAEAQKALKKKGVSMSVADIQATLWYYEKRLYGELGARQSQDISYEEAAQRVLESRGVATGGSTPQSNVGADSEGVGGGGAEVPAPTVRLNQDPATKPVDTNSPEFKAWFGESKAVWDDGTPRVYYHGTTKEFTGFKPKGEATGNAIFFSTDPGPDGAGGYNKAMEGRTIPAYLKIENPFNFRDESSMEAFKEYLGLDAERIKYWQGDPEAEAYMAAWSGKWDYMESPEFQEFLREYGFDSFFVIENGTTNIGVVSPTQIKSAISNTGEFDPNNPSILMQPGKQPLGYLEFNPTVDGKPRQFDLVLLQNENRSTVFHELGHYYLEVLNGLAVAADATDEIKRDFNAIMKWFGVTENQWSKMTLAEKEPYHEKFADAHLLYLKEGNPPTSDLRSAFKKFSKWLTKIGEALISADVEMSDEVRGIFDRLYATDQAIEEARKEVTTRVFTTAEQAGMSQAEFNAYMKTVQKELENGKELLLRKTMADLKRSDLQEYKDEKDKVQAQVEVEVLERPEYAALVSLSEGLLDDGVTAIKLSRQALAARYGNDAIKRLARDRNFVYTTDTTTEGLVDADAAAELLGFSSGDDLINALTDLKPRKKLVEEMVSQRMQEKEPELVRDEDQLREAALEAMNGELREQVLTLELGLLMKKQTEVKPIESQIRRAMNEEQAAAERERQAELKRQQAEANSAEAKGRREARMFSRISGLKMQARAFVMNSPAFTQRPDHYLTLQRRAGSEAYEAALRKDYKAAAEAKEREILNHFLYRESLKLRDQAESFRGFIKRNDKDSVRSKMGKAGNGFLAQFDSLRDRFGIERKPNKQLKADSLATWAQKLMDESVDVVPFSEWLIDEGNKVNYLEFNGHQLADVYNTLKNIKHLAYKELGEIIDGKRIENADRDEMFEQAFAKNLPNKKPLLRDTDPKRDTVKAKVAAFLTGADAAMVKMQQLINFIDGGDVNGPAHKFIWNRLAKAQAEEHRLTQELMAPLAKAMEEMSKEHRNSMDTDKFEVGLIDPNTFEPMPLKRSELLTMLLYSGQETRRQKLIEGYKPYGMTETKLEAALQNLRKEDFELAAKVWDAFDKMRGPVLDLEERQTGLRPEWEESRKFKVFDKNGNLLADLGGGYFPLVADRGLGTSAAHQQDIAKMLSGEGGYARATTSTSHVKTVTKATYPLKLDYAHILTAELANQIRDLTHREAVLSINRIFNGERFRTLMKLHLGEAYEAQLQPWLRNIASERNAGNMEGVGTFNKAATYARHATTTAALGVKLSSLLVQLTDPLRVIAPGPYRVKTSFFISAYTKLAPGGSERQKTIEMIKDLSPMMAQRSDNIDRDLRDRFRDLAGKTDPISKWNKTALGGFKYMDALTSWPAWLGAYDQAMEQHGDQDRAVKEADRVVELVVGSGAAKDLTALQASSNPFLKLMTMFMGDAVSNYNALRAAGAGKAGLRLLGSLTPRALFIIMAQVIGDLLKGQPPEDDESWAEWMARKAALAPMSTVPGVRDLANVFDNILAGKPYTDYKFSPAVSTVQKVFVHPFIHTARLVEGKEDTIDYFINIADSGGSALGIGGTVQATASAKYFKRFAEGEESPDNPAEFLYDLSRGKRKEKK